MQILLSTLGGKLSASPQSWPAMAWPHVVALDASIKFSVRFRVRQHSATLLGGCIAHFCWIAIGKACGVHLRGRTK